MVKSVIMTISFSLLLLLFTGWGTQATSEESPQPFTQSAEKNAEKILSKMESIIQTTQNFESAGWAILPYLDKLVKIGKPAVPKVLKVIKDKSRDPKFRVLLIREVLRNIKDERCLDPLIEIAGDENENLAVRENALKVLGIFKSPKALPLLKDLLHSENPSLREASLYALSGYYDNEEAARAVMEFLQNSNDSLERSMACKALGSIAHPVAIPALIESLKHGKGRGEKLWAAYALGARNLRSEEGIQALKEALYDETAPQREILIALIHQREHEIVREFLRYLVEELKKNPDRKKRDDIEWLLDGAGETYFIYK
ncbi:MAG TPA: HEAT repeat domain-containing protein, partial [bacterium]|nr:HEAT repeat domain-containing protein [bacterium]HEX67790.1 HEAT repeat domain-containing protein [bacterium]